MRHICLLKSINKLKKQLSIDLKTRCYILSCATYHDFHDKRMAANKVATEPDGYGL